MIDEIMYRNDSCYGSKIYNPVKVITYELLELNNTDVLDYCLENYSDSISNDTEDELNNIITAIDNGTVDELKIDDVKDTISNLIDELSENAFDGEPINYVLWLADKETVIDVYDGTDENITGYMTSEMILSNLGGDGILFGYSEKPKVMEEESYY